mmetsp:Transcript_119590/g.284033  ORF Transcript_119590/g.284033 Transcript_119590/m.284033 type:complete len:238 (+) Transcript_119590:543-1256(+)
MSSMESTKRSEQNATTEVMTKSRIPAVVTEMEPSSSSSSSTPPSAMTSRCVKSWKMMYAAYAETMIIEHVRETGSITSSKLSRSMPYCSDIMVPKTVTKVKDKQDKRSIEVFTMAPKILKVCTFSATTLKPPVSSFSKAAVSFCLSLLTFTKPPNKNDMPSTSSTLESTEPSRVALTTAYSPPRRVCTVITISTAFPKVALMRPARRSLRSPAASSSVMSPRIFAIGSMAKKFSQKV